MMLAGVALYAHELLSRLWGEGLKGAEIGVDRGTLSAMILKDTRIAHLDMVDSWAHREDQPAAYRATGDEHADLDQDDQDARMREAIISTEFAGNRRSVLRRRSTSAAVYVDDGSLDFVFIDGDHSYEGVAADIGAWVGKLKPRGLLSGHDYGRPGLACAGVKMAVDEAVEQNQWALELGDEYTWFVRV